jgi:hypothetical protein
MFYGTTMSRMIVSYSVLRTVIKIGYTNCPFLKLHTKSVIYLTLLIIMQVIEPVAPKSYLQNELDHIVTLLAEFIVEVI